MIFPQTLYFQGFFDRLMLKPYGLPLFLPLRAETRANILLPDYHIQKFSGFFLCLPRGVGVNIHCGTNVRVSKKFLHVFRLRSVWKAAPEVFGTVHRSEFSHRHLPHFLLQIYLRCLSFSSTPHTAWD